MRIIKQDLKIYVRYDRDWYISWLKNDKFHREDGPTNIWSNGQEYYHLNNKFYFDYEYWKEVHANY